MRKITKWDYRFLEVARLVSCWSKDPSTRVGVVFVEASNHRILSTGYNGFPRGIGDLSSRLEDREIKYDHTVHAEMNGVFNAVSLGVSLRDSSVYVHGLPVCSECAKGLIQSGVREIIMPNSISSSDKWVKSWEFSKKLLTEAGIDWKFL